MEFDRVKVIDSDIEKQIILTLNKIERDYNVKILHAVESGSRAWGFHSPNSDYDVRFFYVHKRDWYLDIYLGRDVIELPIDKIYDVSGWDLKKALHLALKSNAVVMEWLNSPVIYKSDSVFSNDLKNFCFHSFEEKALIHHYINIGMRQIDQSWRTSDKVKIKKYFYMIRPAMALMWLEQNAGKCNVPMNIQELMLELNLPSVIKSIVVDLIDKKFECEEKLEISRIQELDKFIMSEYEHSKKRVLALPKIDNLPVDKANSFFREWLI